MAIPIEEYLGGVRENGLYTNEAATLGSTLAVTGATTLTGAATLSSTLAVTGATTLTGAVTMSSTLTGAQQATVAVNATAGTSPTLTLGQSGSLVVMNSTTGTYVKLPAPPTVGTYYDFVIMPNALSSGSYGISTGTSTVFIMGSIVQGLGSASASTFVADGATHVSMRMNGTTTGGSGGTYVQLVCASTTEWVVTGTSIATGAMATPFNIAV